MRKTLLFDLDGTLLNTLEDLRDSTNFALRTYGYPERSLEEVRRFVGNGLKMLLTRAVPQGSSEVEIERALACMKAHYCETYHNKTVPYPGIPELLRELCRLPFHWVRLHYLYPDNLSDQLIDTIAGEAKICNYLDIPIQHCNDTVLKAMRRRETKAGLEELFRRVRERIPGVVLRTSLITGLPYEDEAAFEELCDFLGEQKLQRVGPSPTLRRRELLRPEC